VKSALLSHTNGALIPSWAILGRHYYFPYFVNVTLTNLSLLDFLIIFITASMIGSVGQPTHDSCCKRRKKKRNGYLKASNILDVPKTTLKDYVKNKKETPEDMVNVRLGGKTVLPEPIEDELVNYCLEMDKRFYSQSVSNVQLF
jgi:hypothetical protein